MNISLSTPKDIPAFQYVMCLNASMRIVENSTKCSLREDSSWKRKQIFPVNVSAD
jgi:hypothetical protein